MYNFFKFIYYSLPCKKYFFQFLKLFYQPSYKIAKYLKFKGKFKVKTQFNTQFILFSQHTTLEALIFWKGLYSFEPISLKIWEHLVDKNNVILDIGANTGVYSLVASIKKPSSTIYSFEPLLRIYNILVLNIEINKIKNIYPFQKAVSNNNGLMDFFSDSRFDCQVASLDVNHLKKHQHVNTLIKDYVETIKIDDFVKNYSLNSIDLIKIDVEGVENKVIEGMSNVIKKHKPLILCEISSNTTANEINSFFKNRDYYFFHIDEYYGLKPMKKVKKQGLNYLFVPKIKINQINDL